MEKKKLYLGIGLTVFVLILATCLITNNKKDDEKKVNSMSGTIIKTAKSQLTVQDKENVIYTFQSSKLNEPFEIGSEIIIEYTGILNKNKEFQDVDIIKYETIKTINDNTNNTNDVQTSWNDNGIFNSFYKLAQDTVKDMTLDEKIGQLFLVRYPDTSIIDDLKKYHLSGYVFFEKDFVNKSEEEVKKMIKDLQDNSKIPLLTAVDEEGGSVVRISSNPKLVPEKFKSPQTLYKDGGFDLIKEDTINKSKILNNLGLNLNLAPVVDVSTDPTDYMYPRTLGENTELTKTYAKTVIEASKNTGVSYTLKHFPGYGNNANTHNQVVTDNRSYDDILKNDIPPFKEGIAVGAESILVSHNIVTNIDATNPASLSVNVHNLLRNDLGFTGIIITDSIDMSALSKIDKPAIKAIQAGNDLIITTNYKDDIASIKDAINDGTLSEEQIDKLAFRVIAWKYYKGLMYQKNK